MPLLWDFQAVFILAVWAPAALMLGVVALLAYKIGVRVGARGAREAAEQQELELRAELGEALRRARHCTEHKLLPRHGRDNERGLRSRTLSVPPKIRVAVHSSLVGECYHLNGECNKLKGAEWTSSFRLCKICCPSARGVCTTNHHDD